MRRGGRRSRLILTSPWTPERSPDPRCRLIARVGWGVSGKGSGASPSQDALNLVRWSLARGFLDPRRDRLVAVHCNELNPLTASTARVTHELVTPSEFPEWMPPALAHAFGRFAARGGGKGAAAALLESPLAPAEALVRFVSAGSAASPRGGTRLGSRRFAPSRGSRARDRRGGARRDDAARRIVSTHSGSVSIITVIKRAVPGGPLARGRRGAVAATTRRRRVRARVRPRFGRRERPKRRRVRGAAPRRAGLGEPACSGTQSRARAGRACARRAPSLGVRERRRVRAAAGARARENAKGHARSRSFPGNWRMLVDEDEEEMGTVSSSVLPDVARHTTRGFLR